MAFRDYEISLAPILPVLPDDDALVHAVDVVDGIAAKQTAATLASVQAHVRAGDIHYRAQRYEPALDEFTAARALLLKLLHPDFDVPAFVGVKDAVLPASRRLEQGFIVASGQMLDIIRPAAVEPQPMFRRNGADGLPARLERFTQLGFRESIDHEAALQLAAQQGVALLQENKAQAAIDVMEDALDRAAAAGQRIDPALQAALELNVAGAYLLRGEPASADKLARAAVEHFQAAGDDVGRAQALHVVAVSAAKAGDGQGAARLLGQAADLLKATAQPTGPVVGPVDPGPVGPGPVVGPVDPRPIDPGPVVGPVRPVGPLDPGRFTPGPIVSPVRPIGRLQPRAVDPRVRPEAFGAVRFDPSAVRVPVTRDVGALGPIAAMNVRAITFRIPGRGDGWGTIGLPAEDQQRQISKPWKVGVQVGDDLVRFDVGEGKTPTAGDISARVYEPRVRADKWNALRWHLFDGYSTPLYTTHLYAYALPVKIGDCYRRLGRHDRAEQHYLQAAGYSFLNKALEGTGLWIRLAQNALEWGNALYKQERLDDAKQQYAKLIAEDGTVPDSMLYSTAGLSAGAGAARTLIEGITERPLPVVNWEIANAVLSAYSLIQQILQGLDYYGLLLSPIHTFEYLQNVARAFAQEAIQAERQFVQFKNHEELEQATRRDLETTVAMAQAEAEARREQFLAARDDAQAAERALDLARRRRDHAVAQRDAYAESSWAQIWAQAAAAALGGGEDAYWSEISELADRLDRGETISGPGPQLAAAQLLRAGRKTRAYELEKMQHNIDELTRAIAIAEEQLESARHRANAQEIAWQAALQHAALAQEALTAFDDEFFTPDAWSKMADVMRQISRNYLERAIRIAKLMERSYNFENDTDLKVIKNDYGHGVANPAAGADTSLLGGDSLLQDIESFTYHAITSKIRKSSRIKDVISVSQSFPAHFEEFRRTGLLSIETDLYEFDRLHPGFYGQRIEAVELQVVGLLPEGGLNGTVTAGGVTSYRRKDGTDDKRVHQADTMALSDFVLRNDIFLYSTETGVRGLFQGIGLGSTWQLHLPKRSNDFDFRRIFDVELILYYTAMFDPSLRTTVLAAPPRPGELQLLRNYGIRYDFPEAWYAFYRDGEVAFTIDRYRLPMNQTSFEVTAVTFAVVTKEGIARDGIEVAVTGPTGAQGTAATDENGVVSSENAGLASLAGANPLGEWRVEITGGGPVTGPDGLALERVYNIQMGLEYSFEYVAETDV